MAKEWYTVSFSAKLNDDDIKALNKYLYETLAQDMGITEVCALDIDRDRNYDSEDEDDEEDDIDYDSEPEGEQSVIAPDKITIPDDEASFDEIMKKANGEMCAGMIMTHVVGFMEDISKTCEKRKKKQY